MAPERDLQGWAISPRFTHGTRPQTVFAEVRAESARALASIVPNEAAILAKWIRAMHGSGIERFLELLPVDFAALSKGLRHRSFAIFQRRIREFATYASQCGIGTDTSIAAIHRLFEVCLPYLLEQEPRDWPGILALCRLHALVILLVVTDAAETPPPYQPFVEARTPKAEDDRRHEASAYVTKVYEEERRRLSRDLHDEVGHDLVLLKLYLEMIAMDAKKREMQSIRPRLTEAIGLTSHAIDSVRRLVLDLGPAVFDDLGFLPAVRTYTSQFSARTKIAVTLNEGDMPTNVPMSHQIALYRLLQGALSNVLKHSQAKKVKISLGCMRRAVLIMVIQDDGVGFDLSTTPGNRSFGLTAMRERVEVLGGRIHIHSVPLSSRLAFRGTRIEVDLPLPGGAI
jgi:signal transduction histidine kinase